MKQYKYVFIPMQKLVYDSQAIKHMVDAIKDFGEQGWLYVETKPLLDVSLAIFEREVVMVDVGQTEKERAMLETLTSAITSEIKGRA